MRKLVVLDLSNADIQLFENYERQVLPLLGKYGGKLELSVRCIDAMTETHLLHFPDITHFEQFLSDPNRAALKDEWTLTGVKSTITDVVQVDYFLNSGFFCPGELSELCSFNHFIS